MNDLVAITGASGHIGFHVARVLLELGYRVLLLIRTENDNTILLKKLGAEIAIVDFTNAQSFRDLLQGVNVLFHIAAENTIDTTNPERVISNTFGLTKMVIDAAIFQKVQTIIYTSSVVVLGRSLHPSVLLDEHSRNAFAESPYIKGKLLAEDYCHQLVDRGVTDIRRIYPSWVIGSHDQKTTPPHQVIKNYLRHGQWFYFSGGISIAGVHDVAQAHINAWLSGKPNAQYITAGHNVTFKEFYTRLAECAGRSKPFVRIPKWLAILVSKTAKWLQMKSVPDPAYIRSIIGKYSWYSSEKAKTEIGYTITDLNHILCSAVADIKKLSTVASNTSS